MNILNAFDFDHDHLFLYVTGISNSRAIFLALILVSFKPALGGSTPRHWPDPASNGHRWKRQIPLDYICT
jgi:hypothetical protein